MVRSWLGTKQVIPSQFPFSNIRNFYLKPKFRIHQIEKATSLVLSFGEAQNPLSSLNRNFWTITFYECFLA